MDEGWGVKTQHPDAIFTRSDRSIYPVRLTSRPRQPTGWRRCEEYPEEREDSGRSKNNIRHPQKKKKNSKKKASSEGEIQGGLRRVGVAAEEGDAVEAAVEQVAERHVVPHEIQIHLVGLLRRVLHLVGARRVGIGGAAGAAAGDRALAVTVLLGLTAGYASRPSAAAASAPFLDQPRRGAAAAFGGRGGGGGAGGGGGLLPAEGLAHLGVPHPEEEVCVRLRRGGLVGEGRGGGAAAAGGGEEERLP